MSTSTNIEPPIKDKPVIADLVPCYAKLQLGKRYLWCSCGLSKNQPYCDGSHKGTSFMPMKYVATQEDEEVLFCNCKHTKTGPFCDGSHNNLPGGYAEDDPNSEENKTIVEVKSDDNPLTEIDGGCYVFSKERAIMKQNDNVKHTRIISPSQGAKYQSQFYIDVAPGLSPQFSFKARHVVLFITEGEANVHIADKSFPISADSGIYIGLNESFRIEVSKTLKAYLSVCSGVDDIEFDESANDYFNEDLPVRVIGVDPEKRQSMASRYFQILIDKDMGSDVVTQFIGHIPQSKSQPHRHLYEEALIILSGEGMMWTGKTRTAVKGGDVIFLPAKQVHSLQGTGAEGMNVVGIIYPGDNPSINY